MAAGLPVVAPAVGDIAGMVSEANAEFITPPGNEEELRMALVQLAVSKDLRREVGEANRARLVAQFDEAKMIATYRRLYSSAMRIELVALSSAIHADGDRQCRPLPSYPPVRKEPRKQTLSRWSPAQWP